MRPSLRAALVAIASAALPAIASCSTTDDVTTASLAEGCTINSECSSPLVCAYRKCHAACESTRDCPSSQRCMASDRPFHVCQLPQETKCAYHSDCPTGQACAVDGQCRDQCAADRDCVTGQICSGGSCAEPAELEDGGLVPSADAAAETSGETCSFTSDCPAPFVCRDGRCGYQCITTVDCAGADSCVNHRCVPPVCGGNSATGFDAGGTCQYSSQCPAPLVCLQGICGCQCLADVDCSEGSGCVDYQCVRLDAGKDASAGDDATTDAPEVGTDTGADAPAADADASVDAPDAGTDASADAPPDAGPDAPAVDAMGEHASTPTFTIVAGDQQTGFPVSALAAALTVQVLDGIGDPLVGVDVAWAVTSGGGSVSQVSGLTDANGLASATPMLGTLGTNEFTATALGVAVSPIVFTATAMPLTPVAPTPGAWQWQGQHTKFAWSGGTCTGRVAISVGYRTTCYEAADDALRCAGLLQGTVTFGTTHVPAGIGSVDQILSPLAGNDYLVVRATDKTASWLGSNYQSIFGGAASTTTFAPWSVSSLVALGNGTASSLCGLDVAGDVYCSGMGYGATPVQAGGAGPHVQFWVDSSDTLHVDDPAVLRAGDTASGCKITTGGLDCNGTTVGVAGNVVSGGQLAYLPDETSAGLCAQSGALCWLESIGDVFCSGCPSTGFTPETRSYFSPGSVIALATHWYSNNLCAAYQDGSLWCVGSNPIGMLGTGDTVAHPVAVMVEPPGSVFIGCR